MIKATAGYSVQRLINSLDNAIPSSVKRRLRSVAPKFFGWYYRQLSRMAPQGITEVTIQSGPLAGRRFCCNLKNERPYFIGNYEQDIQAAIEEYVRPGAVVYDIGVHRGYFSLMFAHFVGEQGRVFGFEPNPGTIACAKQNLALNLDLAVRISLQQVAISNCTGTEKFLAYTGESQVAALAKSADSNAGATISVQCISIDDFVDQGNPPPQFIKMDIEGAEEFALEAAYRTMHSARPVMLVEIHHKRAFEAASRAVEKCSYDLRLAARISDARPRWMDTTVKPYLLLPSELYRQQPAVRS